MTLTERAARLAAEAKLAEAANAQAKPSSTEAPIAHLKLGVEQLRLTLYGTRSERSARLLDQLELEELKAAGTEAELVAEKAAGKTQAVRSFERRQPVRPTTSSASAWSFRSRRNVPAAGRRGCRS